MRAKILTASVLASSFFSFSSGLQAVTNINTATTTPLFTTGSTGGINITAAGSVAVNTAGKNAITVDDPTIGSNNFVVIAPGVAVPPAVSTASPAVHGIYVTTGSIANSAVITVGQGRAIDANGTDGIRTDQAGSTIFNDGSITGKTHAIHSFAGGPNLKLTNSNTGSIYSQTGPAIIIDDVGFNFLNNGIVQNLNNANPNVNTVILNKNFTQFKNDVGGLIQNSAGGTGNAVIITAPFTANIDNFGTISVTGTAAAINASASGASTGKIINESGGLIAQLGIFVGDAILVNSDIGGVYNNLGGKIGVVNGNGIHVTAASTGPIFTEGQIDVTGNGNAILIEGALAGGITNKGPITALAAGNGIVIKANVAGGIVNTGLGSVKVVDGDALLINSPITASINNSGKLISTGTGTALNVQAKISNSLTNTGLISATGPTGNALKVNADVTLGINNNVGGDINAVNGIAANILAAQSASFINGGNLSVSGTGTVLNVGATIGGSLTNTGTIKATAAGGKSVVLGANVVAGFNNNSGALISAIDQDGVTLNAPVTFTSKISNAGTITTGGAGNALNILTKLGNAIYNTGILSTTGSGNALNVKAIVTGSIDNDLSGKILALGTGTAVNLATDFNQFFNHTNAIVQGTGAAKGVVIGAVTTGNLLNDGQIITDLANAVDIGGNITGIVNTGTIISNNPSVATINATTNITLPQGLKNSGVITNVAGNVAVDFQTAGGSINAPITLLGASFVTGDILIGTAGGATVFDMQSGKVIGNIKAAANPLAADILNFAGGTVSGTTFLSNKGDTVNISGTKLADILGGTGDDIVNFAGGNFTNLDGGIGANTLNLNADFITSGLISNMQTINVNDVDLTVNNAIAGLDTLLNITPAGSVLANANISGAGDLTNDGLLKIANNIIVDMTGGAGGNINNTGTLDIGAGGALKGATFAAQNGSDNFFHILDGSTVGQIFTTDPGAGSVNFLAGSTINLIMDGMVPSGSALTLATSNNIAGVINNATVVQPVNSLVSYVLTTPLNFNSNQILLATITNKADAALFVPDADLTTITKGVHDELLNIALMSPSNPLMIQLVNEFASLDSQGKQIAFANLAPFASAGLMEGTNLVKDSMMNVIDHHLESRRHAPAAVAFNQSNGMNAGDVLSLSEPYWGSWIKGFGTTAHQRMRHRIQGYRGDLAGAAVGFDWNHPNCMTLGAGAGFAQTHIRDREPTINHYHVRSYQAMGYGFFVPYPSVFVDAMIGGANHHYRTDRHFNVGAISGIANGNFHGQQGVAKADLGREFSKDNWYFAPYLTTQYSYLHVDEYTETGAGPLSLLVQGTHSHQIDVGLGFRVAYEYAMDNATLVPEFGIKYLRDLEGDAQSALSSFQFAGGPFITSSARTPQDKVKLDFGLNAYGRDNYVLSANYQLELRDRFVSNNLNLQLYYKW